MSSKSHDSRTIERPRRSGAISVGEVLTVAPDTAEVFRRFGIDPARCADASLKEAALSVGANPQAVLRALNGLRSNRHS